MDSSVMAVGMAAEFWRRILMALPDGVVVTDRDYTILFANRALESVVCREISALIGRRCFDVFAGPLCHRPECPLTRLAGGELRLENDTELHCKGALQVHGTVTCAAYPGEAGGFGGMIERFADATSLRLAQQDLHHSHERLRKTMGALIQAMSLTIEKRDAYTAGHQRRVAKLCRAIATELGFTWERI